TLDDYTLSIFRRQMFMLYMPNRHQTRAIRACIDYLLENARQMNNHLPTPCEITPKDRSCAAVQHPLSDAYRIKKSLVLILPRMIDTRPNKIKNHSKRRRQDEHQ